MHAPRQGGALLELLGDTEETIACYEAAEALGARRIVATTGGELADAARRDGVPVIGLPSGLQPRAAVGYLFTAAAEVAALVGAAPGIRTEIDSSAAHLGEASGALAELAGRLAERLEGSIPVIYGADLTVPVAARWKTQINENAKLPAFAAELPEADHNEIVGLGGSAGTRPAQRRLPRGPRPASARAAADRPDRGPGRARRHRGGPPGDRGRDAARSACCGR